MKTIYITMAAVSALAVAAPLAAQPNRDRTMPHSWQGNRSSLNQLQMRFDAGVESGAISPREAMPLRTKLRELAQLERRYGRAGFNGWERSALQERSRTLSVDIANAERSGDRRSSRNGRFSDNDGNDGRDGRASRDNRGDRFAGDLRVGQRASGRQVALPMQYRDRYKDSDSSYYRYDDNRVYQIDRVTGVIMAMFDITS